MWLENLRDLRARTEKSYKWIAEETNLPERTVTRIFSGDTDHPYVDTVHRIVTALGGSLDSIFADTKVVVSSSSTLDMQADIDRLTADVERLSAELAMVNAENSVLRDKVVALSAEGDILRIKLEYEEKLNAVHTYYITKESK